jgi:hypothetical protein
MRIVVQRKARPLFCLMIIYTVTSVIGMIFEMYIFSQLKTAKKCVDFFTVTAPPSLANIYSTWSQNTSLYL